MKKDSKTLITSILSLGIFVIIVAILYTQEAKLETYIIFSVSYFILIVVAYMLIKSFTGTKQDTEQKQKGEKVVLLTKQDAVQIMNSSLKDEMLMPTDQTVLMKHNVQSENPDTTPTSFYKRLFQDKYNNKYYLQFINREDGEPDLVQSDRQFTNQEIDYHLKNASKSSREYMPVIKKYSDIDGNIVTEHTYQRPRLPKFNVERKEDEIVEG